MIRHADARWTGSLASGHGRFATESAHRRSGLPNRRVIAGTFTQRSRSGQEAYETSPEELIAAAEAACYSMALGAALDRAGTPAIFVDTHATATMSESKGCFVMTHLQLRVTAEVPSISAEAFATAAQTVKVECPISRVLRGLDIEVEASLLDGP